MKSRKIRNYRNMQFLCLFCFFTLFGCKSQKPTPLVELQAIGQELLQKNSIEYSLKLESKSGSHRNDTMVVEGIMFFEQDHNDSEFGMRYYFTSEYGVEFYNGEYVISLYPKDSSAFKQPFTNIKGNQMGLKPFVELSFGSIRNILNAPSLEMQTDSIIRKDTLFKQIPCVYFRILANDTLIDTHKKFKKSKSEIELIFRKQDNLPVYYSQNREMGPSMEAWFSDYSFDDRYSDKDFSIESVPEYYKWDKWKSRLKVLPSGSFAPDWTLPSVTGDSLSLSNLCGQFVLLDFWFIGCGACIQSIPVLNELASSYPENKLKVIGVNCFSKDKNTIREYCTKHEMNFTNVWKGNEISNKYKINAAPIFYLIDSAGRIAYSQVGHDPLRLTNAIETVMKSND